MAKTRILDGMNKLRFWLGLSWLLGCAHFAHADIFISLNTDNSHLVLNGMGEQLSGIDLQSPMGNLVPGTSPQPFAFFLTRLLTLDS